MYGKRYISPLRRKLQAEETRETADHRNTNPHDKQKAEVTAFGQKKN